MRGQRLDPAAGDQEWARPRPDQDERRQGGWYRGTPAPRRGLVPSQGVSEGARRRGPLPPGPRAGGPALGRPRDPRPVARSRRLRAQRRDHPGRPLVGVLRRPTDRQRHARHAPHRGPGLQGRLPPLPHDEGLSRPAQSRLGLPRAARGARCGEGARVHGQGRHRGVRRGGVQCPLPRVGAAPRRRVRGDDRTHGLLGRPLPGLSHDGRVVRRERVVVPQGHLRPGTAGAGPPRGAVLPALRHRPVRPRAGAGLRDRGRPLGLRALPAHLRSARRPRQPAGVDDDAVDPGVQHRRGGQPRRRLRPGEQRRRAPRRRGGAGGRRSR